MGTTLANIHIYTENEIQVCELLSDNKYQVLSISKNWTSILYKGFIEKDPNIVGRRLSKKISVPVLSFMYFDDDLMSLTLFNNGKTSAAYYLRYGYNPSLTKCKNFINDLGFEESDLPRLRKIFKCSDLDKKINMLEEFFGVALYICLDFIEEGTHEFIRKRETTIYDKYIKQQKKLNKIKNFTKAEIVQEIDGKVARIHLSKDSPFISLAKRNKNNIYNTNNVYFYKFVDDTYIPFFSYSDSNSYLKTHEIRGNFFICSHNYEPVDKIKYNYLSYTEKTQEISLVKTFDYPINILNILNNSDILCYNLYHSKSTEEKEKIFRMTQSGKIVWSYIISGRKNTCKILINEDYILAIKKTLTNTNEFVKIDFHGNILSKFDTKYPNDSTTIIYKDEFLYFFDTEYTENEYHDLLIKMNITNSIISKLELPSNLNVYSNSTLYNQQANEIYCSTFDNKIIIVNLDTLEYLVKEYTVNLCLNYIDSKGYIYAQTSSSNIFILNNDLKIVSKHRLKGSAFHYMENKNGVHIITCTGNYGVWGFSEPDCTVRVYKIEFNK